MKKKVLLILTVLVLCLSFSIDDVESATYYLDAVNGNDANPGTSSQPWKTLTYALGIASPVGPGDTVYLRRGTYREQVEVKKYGTDGNWITVKSYPGEKAVLDGTEPVTGWTKAQSNDSYLAVQGVVNPNYNNIYWTRVKASQFPSNLSGTVMFEDRTMCRIASDPDQSQGFGEDTFEMRDVSQGSEGQGAYLIDTTLTQADDYWNGAIVRILLYAANAEMDQRIVADWVESENKAIFDSSLAVNITTNDRYRFVNHPHILDSAGEFYVSNIETIDGVDYRRVYYWPTNPANLTDKITMTPRSYAFWGIQGVAYYLSIEDVTIFGTKSSGILFYGLASQYGSYVTVKNCTITDCGGDGINFTYMNDVRAEGNYIRRCNLKGIFVAGCNRAVAKNNNVGNTGSTNISFRPVVHGMIINNTLWGLRGVHGNGTTAYGQGGIWCEDILVAGNTYYNANMAFNDCKNLVVFGNLFCGNPSDPSYAITPWSSRYDGYQVWINNTAPIATGYALLLHQQKQTPDLPRHYVVNNVFYGLLKGWTENWDEYDLNKVRVEDRTYNVYTYYTWQQQPSAGWYLQEGEQDLRSTPFTDIFVDPTYPDGDYHPNENGPLHHTGKNVQTILTNLGIIAKFPEYNFTKDLEGNPWNINPSIGCYEYGATLSKGDLNKDGKVNIQDVQACVNHMLGKQDWGSVADVNKDGKVNEEDVKEIVNIILKQ